MRIGVLGGTFDPPHLGHLILAAEALEQLRLQRLLWVLTPDNPLKEGAPATPLSLRVEMLQACMAANPAFEFSRVDLDRPPPYYAYETMQRLAEVQPGAALIYLMGSDSLADLPRWKCPQEFLAACHALGVMRRPGVEIDLASLERQLPGLAGKVRFVEAPPIGISSTWIRRKAAAGGDIRYYLPEKVYEIVAANGLYRQAPPRG